MAGISYNNKNLNQIAEKCEGITIKDFEEVYLAVEYILAVGDVLNIVFQNLKDVKEFSEVFSQFWIETQEKNTKYNKINKNYFSNDCFNKIANNFPDMGIVPFFQIFDTIDNLTHLSEMIHRNLVTLKDVSDLGLEFIENWKKKYGE